MTIMPVLSQQAHDLITTCRGALRPTGADRDRVEACLRAILGEAALPVATAAVPTVSALSWKSVVVGAIGVGLVGGFFAAALESHASKTQHDSHAARMVPVPVSVADTDQEVTQQPALGVTAQTESPSVISKTATSSRPKDQLAQEVALLTHATSALNAGHVREALSVLAEHERRFPEGVLSIERRGAKAKALCALGRASEAQAELAQLPPDSLAATRAGQNCGTKTP